MKPKKNFRSRPKKTGARKVQKIASQKRRLIAIGHTEEKLKKMNSVEIRTLIKVSATKKAVRKRAEKKTT
ncbi:MAG: hypothetical protein ABH862_00465 [Candidatus Omnitrophota bacterium]